MSNKMIIDASHPEETRVVVLRGNRVEEFDFESANKKPLRGNIYLAKVTRVEPSLQAAFVEYGGNRHGFLAFSEIHPDYYQIPVADRQALLEEEARSHREDEEEPANERRSRRRQRGRPPEAARAANEEQVSEPAFDDEPGPSVDDAQPYEFAAPEMSPGVAASPNVVAEAPDTAAEAAEAGFEDAPFVAVEEETPAEIAAEVAAEAASFRDAGASEDVDGFASVNSDEPSEEMAPRVERGEPPLREGFSADEDGPAVEIEAQAARDEAEEAEEAAAEEEEDAHEPEVTTIGGGARRGRRADAQRASARRRRGRAGRSDRRRRHGRDAAPRAPTAPEL